MKKILIIIMMFITLTSTFALNDNVIGKIEGLNNKYIKINVNEKSNIYLETDTRMTFYLSGSSLSRFIKLLNINLELVEVGNSSDIRYQRDSGQLWGGAPSIMFGQLEYYCSGKGGLDSSTITVILTDLNRSERIALKPDQVQKLLSLINESLSKKKDIKTQIDEFNNIIDKIREY